jgi:superfamily II RNA helicase
MVKLCTANYSQENNEKYLEYFNIFPFPLSDFQKYAIEGLINNKNVLITAHTGSGKTLPAEFAIDHFHKKGKKIIYTSPIKALSNQKFHEFTQKFPHINFGILTGDIKFNPDADVLIMTTEILQNTLFTKQSKQKEKIKSGYSHFEMDIDNELACVIFDEVHYINDEDRGKVWEQTIMLLPPTVQMLMLSATIDKPDKFAKWVEEQHIDADNKPTKECYLVPTDHRIVPLYHYIYMDSNQTIFKTIKDKDKHSEFNSIIRKLHLIKSANTQFNDTALHQINTFQRLLNNNKCFIKPNLVLNNLLLHLKNNDMLPAICFIFSRKNVENYAHQITVNLLEDDSNIPAIAARECNNILRKLPNYNEIISLPEFNTIVKLLEKGIAIHHSGIMPVLREMIELMFSKGFVKVLFATETFAVGINMPTKTVIFTSLSKYTSKGQRYLLSHEYTQMAGRAGRRGLDTKGHVIHCYNMFNNNSPSNIEYKLIMNGVPQTLKSKFQVDYPLILNIIKSDNCDLQSYTQTSMLNKEFSNSIIEQTNSLQIKQLEYEQIENSYHFSDELFSLLQDYTTTEKSVNLLYGNKRKKAMKKFDKCKEDIYKIVDGKHTVQELCDKFKLHDKLKKELAEQEQYLHNLENYLLNQSNHILYILHQNGFISQKCGESNDATTNTSYEITEKGVVASSIREVPSIIFAQLICDNKFDHLSVDEFITFLSCFNEIKIRDEFCINNMDDIPNHILNSNIREILRETQTLIDTFCFEEDKLQIFTGEFDVKIQFDLIPYVVRWLKADNEMECRTILSNMGENIGVFLGDFSKTLIKINNISNELFQVFTERNNIKLAHMVSQISERIMKFVVTNQSLYV